MKTRVGSTVFALMRKLIFIGFTVQIAFGLLWIAYNIDYVQLFGDAAYYVMVSGSLKCDEYTGILYPVVLLLARAIGMLTSVHWYSIMYLLQLLLAGVSGYFLFKTIGFFGKKYYLSFFASLCLVTFPLILQIHMAILPMSFSLSFILLELAYAYRACVIVRTVPARSLIRLAVTGKRTQGAAIYDFSFDISKVTLFWLLAALTELKLFVVGIIPVLYVLILELRCIRNFRRQHKEQVARDAVKGAWIYPIAIVMIFTGLIMSINRFARYEGIYDRPSRSIAVSLFDRTIWKSHIYREGSWLDEIVEVVGTDMLKDVSLHQENVKRILEPAIENALGKNGAERLYMFAAGYVWKHDRSELLHDMAIDFSGYTIPPVMTALLLKGTTYISYTPRNYDVFKRNTPLHTKYMVNYGLLWFVIALVIALINWMAWFINKRINFASEKIIGHGLFFMAMLMAALLAAINTMQLSGTYDYKQGALSTALWLVFILQGISLVNRQFEALNKQAAAESSEPTEDRE